MKIKFISNGLNGEVYHGETYVNPAYFFIRAYYQLHGLTNVTWLPCELTMLDPYEVQLERVVGEQPDLVALSVYVWNEDYQYKLAHDIKQRLPNTTVVLGGPQLTAHKNPEFFNKHPYVDYVGYGDGERAFQLIVDRVSGKLPSDTALVNVVENLHPGYKLWPFEIINDEKYLSTSSFLIQQDEVVKHINQLIDRGIPKNTIVVAVEFARGCMYGCTFCDWSQNLTKKVKRRTHNWQAEIDFFHKLDIVIREADANFGQWPEDLKIFDYAVSLYDPTRTFKFRVHNTPKLKKDAAYHIMMTQAKVYGFRIHVALQDINESVLQNIDRPSLTWDEHKSLIRRMQTELPTDKQHLLGVQVIVGLPGQTYSSIMDMHREMYLAGIRQGAVNVWVYLDNSPAADPTYQRLHGLEWIDAYILVKPELEFDTLDNLYKTVAENADPLTWTKLKIIKKTRTLSLQEILQAQVFRQQFSKKVGGVNTASLTASELDTVIQELDSAAKTLVDFSYAQHEPLIDKHGFIIFGTVKNNKIGRVYVD